MYEQIKTKENYNKLIASGMFWEFHPELTGNWEIDKDYIIMNKGIGLKEGKKLKRVLIKEAIRRGLLTPGNMVFVDKISYIRGYRLTKDSYYELIYYPERASLYIIIDFISPTLIPLYKKGKWSFVNNNYNEI